MPMIDPLARRSVLGLLGSMIAGAAAGSIAACRRRRLDIGKVDRDIRDEPRGGCAFAIGLFAQAGGTTVPPDIRVVRTAGFDMPGIGAALYAVDETTTGSMVATHPRCAFRAADGRVFRLRNAVLRPEMFGARADGVGNDQPALQAMLDHAAATRTMQVRLAARTYAVWCPPRTTPDTGLATDGVPLVVRSGLVIEGTSGRTALLFRSPSGADRTHSYQVVNGRVWRGGGVYLVGNTDASTQLNIERFKIRGVKLDGGIVPSGNHAECTVANGGDGWDTSDKGFRVQDSKVGHILLEDVEITGFRGELAYGGGTGSILSLTTRRCWFHGTNADAYNFDCGQPILDVDGRWGEAFQPIEAHGGPGSRFERTTWYDCEAGGTLWGGRIGAVDEHGKLLPGTTYAESARDDPDRIPWVVLNDVRAVNCGSDNTPLLLANWVKGTIWTTDTNVYLTPAQTGQLTTMNLVIHAVADRRPVDAVVGLSGATSLYQAGPGNRPVLPPTNVQVAVSMAQTPNAMAQGFGFRLPVQADGFFGDAVAVRVVRGRSATYPKLIGMAPSMPLIEDAALEVTGGDQAWIIEELTDASILHRVRFTSTHMLYVGDGNHGDVYRVVPATDGFADGQLVVVRSRIEGYGLMIEVGKGRARTAVRLRDGQTAALAYAAHAREWRPLRR